MFSSPERTTLNCEGRGFGQEGTPATRDRLGFRTGSSWGSPSPGTSPASRRPARSKRNFRCGRRPSVKVEAGPGRGPFSPQALTQLGGSRRTRAPSSERRKPQTTARTRRPSGACPGRRARALSRRRRAAPAAPDCACAEQLPEGEGRAFVLRARSARLRWRGGALPGAGAGPRRRLGRVLAEGSGGFWKKLRALGGPASI